MKTKRESRNMQRVVAKLVSPLVLSVALAGCAVGDAVVGASIAAADRADSALLRSRGQNLLAKQLQRIEELRTKGDPLGEYLWVEANAEGLVDNPELDPEKLFTMYQTAAAKGSPDALVAMGVMLFSGKSVPNMGKAHLLPKEKRDMKKGLELIEQGTRERCWYWELIIQTLHSQNCLRPIIAADKVWPKFRDGFLWPKDEALMNQWKAKSAQCEQDSAQRQAYASCN